MSSNMGLPGFELGGPRDPSQPPSVNLQDLADANPTMFPSSSPAVQRNTCPADGGWSETAAGELVAQACHRVMNSSMGIWEGTASRLCGADTKWLPAVTTKCGLKADRISRERNAAEQKAIEEVRRIAQSEAAATAAAHAAERQRLAREADAAVLQIQQQQQQNASSTQMPPLIAIGVAGAVVVAVGLGLAVALK